MNEKLSTVGMTPAAGAVELPVGETAKLGPAELAVASPTDVGVVAATPVARAPELEWPFLLNQQRYLLESARFADQKSAFAFAFAIGCLAFLHKRQAFDGAIRTPLVWLEAHTLPALAGGLLLLSCGLLLAAILPRLWWSSEHQLNLVFWEDVRQFGSPDKYFAAVRQASPDTLHREVSDHCYTLAGICERKFSLVKYGMWAGTVGAVLTLLTLT